MYIHTSRSRVRDLGELVTISTLCPHAFAFPPPRIQEFREFIGHVPNLLGLFQVLFAFLGNDQRPRLARWHHLHARSGAQDSVRPRAARKSRGQPHVGNVKRKRPLRGHHSGVRGFFSFPRHAGFVLRCTEEFIRKTTSPPQKCVSPEYRVPPHDVSPRCK